LATNDDENRWRKALNALGAVQVRQLLQRPVKDDDPESEESGVVTDASHPSRRFIDAWYRDSHRRRQRTKDVRQYVVAVVALAIVGSGILFLMVR